MKCCGPNLALVSTISGAILCAIGGVLYNILPGLIHDTILKRIVLSNTSEKYDYWVEPPLPIYFTYYFFNYTNHEDFLKNWDKGVKPKVQETGPYVYRLHLKKEDIDFDENGETVTYNLKQWYEFQSDMSHGLESDMVVIPNIPYRAVTYAQPDMNDSVALLLEMVDPSSFVKHSIEELLFKGYHEELFSMISMYLGEDVTPGNRFAIMLDMNDTTTGPIIADTGKKNIMELGKILTYENYSTEVPFWNGTCNMINGSDGSNFPPVVSKEDRIYIFNGALCRSVYLTFKKEVDHHGIKAYRYEQDFGVFADVNINPENQCFCTSELNKCLGVGLFNIAACKMNAQVHLSYPHFLNAENRFRTAIDGLSPDHDKHMFQMDIEPITGSPVNVSVKLQTNLAIMNTPWLPDTNDMPEIVLPLMWFAQTAEVDAEMATTVTSKLYTAIRMGTLIPVMIMSLGGIIGIMGVICSNVFMYKGKNQVSTFYKGKTPIQAFAYN